ncbi:MAG: carbonic anhydrase family protein [Balneolaceae bacterium]
MLTNKPTLLIAALFIAFAACAPEKQETTTPTLSGDTITAAEQAALTPDEILTSFEEGNVRYMNNDLTPRDYSAQIAATSTGQYPKAVILSCIDSRVPVEKVFDKGVGDVFVARVAGNTVNPDILGSIEYGAAVAGSKLVVVMGHEACGAVKAAIDKAELSDNADVLLGRIQPAIDRLNSYAGDQSTKNADYVDQVVNTNVSTTIEAMLIESPVLKSMQDEGKIKIVGAYYDLDTGKVTFVEDTK